jgi:hypothetical protein
MRATELQTRSSLEDQAPSTPAGASSDQEVIVQRSCLGLKLVVACR